MTKYPQLKKRLLIFLIAAALSACSSGGSSNEVNSVAQPTTSNSIINGGTYSAGSALSQRTASSSLKSANDNLLAAVAAQPYTPVGWNSTLNTMAPVNCWNYTATLTNPDGDTSLGTAMSSSKFEQSLGVDVSLSGKFDIFSASNSTSYSSMKSTDQFSISSFNNAITRYLARVSVSGLSDAGQQILKTQPANFISLCGDRVIADIPLKLQAGINMVFSSQDSSLTSSFSDKVSAGAGFADLSVGISSDVSNKSTGSSVTYHQFTFGDNALFPSLNDSATAALNDCLSSGKNCNDFLVAFNANYAQATDSARKSFIAQNGSNWGSIYASDYAKFADNFKAYDIRNYLTSDQLQQLTNPANNTFWTPYTTTINKNLIVLGDLDVAQTIFKQIQQYNPTFESAAAISAMLDYPTVMTDYSLAFADAENNLKLAVSKCIYAQNQSDAETYCQKLDPNVGILELLSKSLKPLSSSWYSAELQGLLSTVRLMIYNVQNNITFTVATSLEKNIQNYQLQVPQKLLTLPLATLESTTINIGDHLNNWMIVNARYSNNEPTPGGHNDVRLLSTPNFSAGSTQTSDITLLNSFPALEATFNGVNITYRGYGTIVYTINNLWPSTQKLTDSNTGFPGTFLSYIQAFTGYPGGPSCVLYSSTSQGCKFSIATVFTPMAPYEGVDGLTNIYNGENIISITDNSSSALFKTLYPYQ